MGLTEFPSNVLRDLNKLQSVDLQKNHLTNLPAGIFKGFQSSSKQVIIELSTNNIAEIHPDAFYQPEINMTISRLNLIQNHLTNIMFLYHGCDLLLDNYD